MTLFTLAWVGMLGGDGQRQKQIPPLRYGMTNKRATDDKRAKASKAKGSKG
jgi:hypothetical protein